MKRLKLRNNINKNLNLISSVMLRKLRLRQKKWFSYKKKRLWQDIEF